MIHGQLHLDFLSQSGPQEAGEDVRALCSKRTVFAEQVGDLRRQWQHLQRQLEGQVSSYAIIRQPAYLSVFKS